ncbi:MAG: 2-C-methyl-D-erythritol 4-phosphate cytidylyltransferase [Chitinophagales bacterium]|nr:2-C-methyl-D-erythritol 4-phosphate cytidylyltransferase [Chitinophagaceae bacterium]MCB9065046.1 2-C-methyl-D-erythritol 4-phosphate cytidylyltransferase [Chitinophagales bacterium]
MKKYAVIVAGGKGVRMGMALPKQFLPVGGKPVLFHTIKAFYEAYDDMNIVLVLPEDQLSYAQMVLQAFEGDRPDITIVTGGATRFHSVQNGLKVVEEESIVFVHDGVRPLVSVELICACYEQAFGKGSAIPAIAVSDSIRSVDGDDSTPVDRSVLRAIQTPQTFKSEILLPAFEQGYSEQFTDEATVVEANGEKVYLIEGDKRNVKLTTPEDLEWADMILKGDA